MKKIFLLVTVAIVLILSYQFNNIKNSINLYKKLYDISFVEYVNCSDILNKAVSRRGNYTDVSEHMSEEVYNTLSIKTKSFYKENQLLDQTIYIINQTKDLDNDKIINVDFILYDNQDNFVKKVKKGRVRILKNMDNWKVLDYMQSDKPVGDEYIGNVYFFVLPKFM